MNVQHSSRNDSWMTPVWLLDLVRQVIGPIDLDPASSSLANERVQAARYFTEADDALAIDWPSVRSVFLNPPGGKVGNASKAIMFWQKLHEQHCNWREFVYMGFSAEHLQTSQGKGVPSMMQYTICVPRKRIAFDEPPPSLKRNAPSHSNVVVYGGPWPEKFTEVFSTVGDCK